MWVCFLFDHELCNSMYQHAYLTIPSLAGKHLDVSYVITIINNVAVNIFITNACPKLVGHREDFDQMCIARFLPLPHLILITCISTVTHDVEHLVIYFCHLHILLDMSFLPLYKGECLGKKKFCNTKKSQHVVCFYIPSPPKQEQAEWGHNCSTLVPKAFRHMRKHSLAVVMQMPAQGTWETLESSMNRRSPVITPPCCEWLDG